LFLSSCKLSLKYALLNYIAT